MQPEGAGRDQGVDVEVLHDRGGLFGLDVVELGRGAAKGRRGGHGPREAQELPDELLRREAEQLLVQRRVGDELVEPLADEAEVKEVDVVEVSEDGEPEG